MDFTLYPDIISGGGGFGPVSLMLVLE